MAEWKTGTPAELVADLRPGGWLVGHSGIWPKQIRLHKTDMIADLRKMEVDSRVTWRIAGDPNESGQFAKSRRTIVLWLGK